MPDVSVILPVRNAEKTIERAVHSILNQTFEDLELIVVDDGSDDSTQTLLHSITDSRLRVISTKKLGVVHASNLAFENSSAPIIARMDADDYSLPSRIEKQKKWLESNDLDVTGCQVRIVNSKDEPVESMQRYQRWINEESLDFDEIQALRFVELPIVNPSILAKREYFALKYVDDQFPEDYDLFLRAAAKKFRFGKVPEVLLDWSELPGRLTRTDPRYSELAFDRCRKKYLFSGPLQGITTVDLWGVGNTGKPWMRWLQSQGIKIGRCFDVSPRKIGQRIHGTIVEDPESLVPVDKRPLIVAVGSKGARDLIIPFVQAKGMRLGENVWFVA